MIKILLGNSICTCHGFDARGDKFGVPARPYADCIWHERSDIPALEAMSPAAGLYSDLDRRTAIDAFQPNVDRVGQPDRRATDAV